MPHWFSVVGYLFFLCQSSLPPFYRSFTRLECFALGPFYGPKPSVHLQFLTCSLWETLKRVIFHRHHFSARRFAIRYASHIGRPHPPCHAIAPSRDPQHLRHVRQARPGTQERFEDPAWGSCWYFFRWIQQVHTHVYTCTYIYIYVRWDINIYIYTHVLYLSVYASLFVYLSLHRHIYIYIYPYTYIYIYICIYYTHVWSYMCKWWLVHCKQTCACWRPTTSMGTLILIPSHLGVQKNGRRFRLFTDNFGKIWVDLPFCYLDWKHWLWFQTWDRGNLKF